MSLKNWLLKAQIAASLGSLAASVVLKGHDQKKNEEVIGKFNDAFEKVHTLQGGDDEF